MNSAGELRPCCPVFTLSAGLSAGLSAIVLGLCNCEDF